MLKSITLDNFKCFKHQEIQLAPLTLFTGLNNSGKSSVFQAIRMVSNWHRGKEPTLPGHGSLSELKNKNSTKSTMGMTCKFDNDKTSGLHVKFLQSQTPFIQDTKHSKDHFPLLAYLSADRWGPRVSLPLLTSIEDLIHTGDYGEYVLDYLARHENDIVPPSLRHPDSEGDTLEYNVRAWLGEISPNVSFKHYSESKRDSSYATLDSFRPTNSGFGIGYALPIIVNLLGISSIYSRQSDFMFPTIFESPPLILIENPEAHLHPKGQVRMGMLIAMASRAGVQVLVESHSDHIFNGLRVAVHDGVLDNKDIMIHYFSRNRDGGADLISPKMDENGRLDRWPDGFFDEWDKALDRLLFPSKKASEKEVVNGTDIQ